MAVPICPSCKSSLFETADFTPQGYRHRLLSVHCSNCGSIAAILDHHSDGKQLDHLANLVESLNARLDNLDIREAR
jgi:hypothetical protein